MNSVDPDQTLQGLYSLPPIQQHLNTGTGSYRTSSQFRTSMVKRLGVPMLRVNAVCQLLQQWRLCSPLPPEALQSTERKQKAMGAAVEEVDRNTSMTRSHPSMTLSTLGKKFSANDILKYYSCFSQEQI